MPSTSARLSLVTLALALAACAPDKDPLDTLTGAVTAASNSGGSGNGSNSGGSGNTSNSGGTDGATSTTGVTDGGGTESASASGSGPGGTTGVEPGQPAQVCLDLLACIGVIAPETLGEAEAAYGPDSACWTSPDLAEECAMGCEQGLASYGRVYPDVPECGGEVGPGTTTEPGTTGQGGDWGNCGWDVQNSYYGCVGGPGEPDPDGIYPIDCPPDLPPPDAPCGEITDIGCCTPAGDNYYCGQAGIVVEGCGP